MKRIYQLIIAGIFIAILLYIALQIDPGFVRISVGHWVIDTNLFVLAIANIAVVCVVLLGMSLLKHILLSHHYLRSWLSHAKQNRATRKTNDGLLAFLEGNWSDAAKMLKRSAKQSATPIVNYLAAAHAENEQGNNREAERLLQKAYEKTDDSDFAVGIAKAQMELDQNQLESCLATLVRLKQQKPHHPFVLKLLRSVYIKLEDWRQLIQLLPELKKLPNADKAKLTELEEQAWRALFTHKADELQRNQQYQRAAEELADLWKQLPENIRFDASVILNYAEQLKRLKNENEAEALLRTVLNKNWHDALIEKYGEIKGSDPAEQLLCAEAWLKSRPNNPSLLLTLGRLSLQNELWGKALEYFEACNALQSSRECLGELCRLEQQLGRNQDAAPSPNLDRLLQTLALPDLPLPKNNTRP